MRATYRTNRPNSASTTACTSKGGFFIGDGAARFRGADGTYWNLNATNLGLDTRSIDAEGGKQGRYKLSLKYDETSAPHFGRRADAFRRQRRRVADLAGRISGGDHRRDAAGGHAAAGRLSTQRKRWAWADPGSRRATGNTRVKFSHETTRRHASAPAARSSSMRPSWSSRWITSPTRWTPPPRTRASKLQTKLAYYGSKFGNNNDALTWQDPFTPAIAGAAAGQLALPPDNQFHQVLASAGYQFSDKTRGSADIAWGRMTQNQGFLASTLNAGLAVPGLPGGSLDGRAATLDANLKLTSAVTQPTAAERDLHATTIATTRRRRPPIPRCRPTCSSARREPTCPTASRRTN